MKRTRGSSFGTLKTPKTRRDAQRSSTGIIAGSSLRAAYASQIQRSARITPMFSACVSVCRLDGGILRFHWIHPVTAQPAKQITG